MSCSAVRHDTLSSPTCSYLDVIIDICKKMQTGMADYAHKAQTTGSVYIGLMESLDQILAFPR